MLLLLMLTVVFPLLAMLWRGVAGDASQGGGLAAAATLLGSANFRWLLGNSLKVSLTVALIVVPLAYAFAYALQRTCIPGKPLCSAAPGSHRSPRRSKTSSIVSPARRVLPDQ